MCTIIYMCVHLCPVTVVTSTVQSIMLSPHPCLHLIPLSSASQPEVMSLCADGAQIKLTPAPLLLSIRELKLVYFYDLFISLLPPPAFIRRRQQPASGSWPEPQVLNLSGQISPQSIKIKPIVMVIQ